MSLEGLWGSAKAMALVGLLPDAPCLVVTGAASEITRLGDDLRFFASALGVAGPDRVVLFTPPHAALWLGGRHREEEAERAAVLFRLQQGEPCWVVSSPEGLGARLPSPEAFRAGTLTLSPGMALDREALAERLTAFGYERVEMVTEVGQWALRGGIVDLFSPARPTPVRLELFGDEVESLRAFDPSTQRSTGTLGAVPLLPLLEAIEGDRILLDYLPPTAPVAVEDPTALPPTDGGPDIEPLLAGRTRIELGLLGRGEPAYGLDTRSVGGMRGQFRQLAAQVTAWRAEGFRVRLVASEPGQVERLRRILLDHDLEAVLVHDLLGPEPLAVLHGGASAGFECPPLGLVVLTETEIFGGRRRALRRPAYQRGRGVTAVTDLAPGDFVVHAEHGIGRYTRLATLSVDGQEGDYLLLEYAEGDKLYLPVQRLGAVSKYVGTEGVPPRLERLGGTSWQRVKESVRASLREMAQELLQIYARRRIAEGQAVGPDTPWQHEFEAAFPFEETPDQLEAIREVKADMERPRPMDRLVCGDVGYGKTEVALRAAFKAVMDGKQAAVLAPTTILAQQHWETFKGRFAPFPVRIEMLSRFRTPREQKGVLAGLRAGTVDVVIGTHRLLSRDVAFKDLGLLVIDEEHRFGVGHKERLKRLRTSVDILTLTATPIPRTLSMALSGIRDLTVIETPPADRLAVETVVCRFDRTVIKEAIERELDRGGQVFFVHNRIQSLASLTRFLQRLVPRARIAMAHGQMPERTLESVMLRFVRGEYDLLVSTAIVESGLDIPASNTMIVNRADRFGLAQLYQLRGRVGRERLQAYAYLLIPADGRVDETAAKRLKVIQELTELGSGLKLALRDLEIRGAGNLLGAEQHGHIAAVGFDLYLKLLEQAVRELRGEPEEEEVDPVVTVEVSAYLPESYVAEPAQRLALYQRLAGVRGEAEIEAIVAELTDRFGPLPRAARQLLDVVTVRLYAKALAIERLEARRGRVLLTFAAGTPVKVEQLLALLRSRAGEARLVREFVLEVGIPAGPWPAVYAALVDLLKTLG